MLAPALVLFLIRVIVNQNNMTLISGDSATWFMIKKTMLGFAKNDKLNFFQETFLNKVYLSTYICIIIFIVLSIVLTKRALVSGCARAAKTRRRRHHSASTWSKCATPVC